MRTVLGQLMAVAVLIAACLTPAARGQEDLLEDAGPFGLPVSWRVVLNGCEALGFDADQKDSARSLYQGYRAAVRSTSEKANKASEELRKSMQGEDPDWQAYSKKRSTLIRQYVDDLDAFESGLMSDLKALCNAAQEASFVTLERGRRRDKGRVFTLAPGEAIDIVLLMKQFKVDHSAGPLHDAVSTWEDNIDRHLITREKLFREAMRLVGPDGEEPNPEQIKDFFRQYREIATRIGDLNRRTVNEIVELIPEEKREPLRRDARVRTFPRIYGDSAFDRAVGSAKTSANLTPDQVTRVDELAAKYATEVAPINVRWAAAADDKFRNMGDDPMMAMGFGAEPDEKEPFFAIRKERRALEERYRARLLDLLNEGQRAEVAKSDEDERHTPEYLPDFERDMEGRLKEWKDEEKE